MAHRHGCSQAGWPGGPFDVSQALAPGSGSNQPKEGERDSHTEIHQREAFVLCVEFVEAQVDDQGSHCVEEGKDAKGHKELGGGREVSHEVHGFGGGVLITERHLILDLVQPEGIAEQNNDGAHVLGFVVAENQGSRLPAVRAAGPEGENSKELRESEAPLRI